MLEYEFLKLLNDYIPLYKEYLIPVVISDVSFKVYWSNAEAKAMYPHFSATAGLRRLLMEFDHAQLISRLELEGTVRIDGVPAFGGLRLNLSPIRDSDGAAVGAAVLLVDAGAGVPLEHTLGSRTPQMLQQSVRRNMADIFSAMDAAALKADILQAGWVKSAFRGIAQNSYSIMRAADNIAAYADFQSHPPVPSTELSDIFDLLRLYEGASRGLAAGMGIPLRFELPEQYDSVGVDADKFLLAFFNVLHNALYFTKPGNEVTVTGAADGNSATVTVADKGVGIPAKSLPNIFRAYFSHGHDGRQPGIGLGLTIAKIITEAHGGEISVKSLPDKGTAVTMSFSRRPFSRRALLSQSGKLLSFDRFSSVYVGLCDAAESPYRE